MGLFSALSGMAVKEAYSILKDFRRGRGNSQSVIQALKILANSNLLYKWDREGDCDLHLYYWEIDRHLENIEGDNDDLPPRSSRNYVKVRASECNDIDCSRCY